jgi:hypothetical protein
MVFTLPAPISDIAYQNKAEIYDILLKASKQSRLNRAGPGLLRCARYDGRGLCGLV